MITKKNVNVFFYGFLLLLLLMPGFSILKHQNNSLLRVDQLTQIYFFLCLIYSQHHAGIIKSYKLIFFSVFISLLFVFSSSAFFLNPVFSLYHHIEGFSQLVLLLFFVTFGLYLPVLSIKKNLDLLTKILNGFGLGLVTHSVYQLISYYTCNLCFPLSKIYFNNPSLKGYGAVHVQDGIYRATSIFKEPSHLGFIMCALILFNLGFSDNNKRYFLLPFFILGAFLANSMFAFLALIISVSLIFPLRSFLLFVVTGLLISFTPYIDRFIKIYITFRNLLVNPIVDGNDIAVNIVDPSFMYRFEKFLIALSVFRENLFGIGFNNLIDYTQFFQDKYFSHFSKSLYVVNFYFMQFLTEAGIFGFFILLAYLIYISFKFFANYKIAKVHLLLPLYLIFYQDLPIFSPLRIFVLFLFFILIREKYQIDDK